MADNYERSSPSRGSTEDKKKRKIRFMPVPKTPKLDLSLKQDKVWSPIQGFRVRTSLWLWIAIMLLLVSNILYTIAFLTNSWGVLMVDPLAKSPILQGSTTTFKPEEGVIPPRVVIETLSFGKYDNEDLFTEGEKYWKFGLWECCRNDGFCLGTRWPAFYSATRAFSVLGLFGHILTLGWLAGHALENLLEYDPCTVVSLIALNISTSVFVLLSTVIFGTRWPLEFGQDFNGYDTYLSYSFYLAVTCTLLTAASSVFSIVDFVVTLRSLAQMRRENWVSADQILGDDDNDNVEEKSFLQHQNSQV